MDSKVPKDRKESRYLVMLFVYLRSKNMWKILLVCNAGHPVTTFMVVTGGRFYYHFLFSLIKGQKGKQGQQGERGGRGSLVRAT